MQKKHMAIIAVLMLAYVIYYLYKNYLFNWSIENESVVFSTLPDPAIVITPDTNSSSNTGSNSSSNTSNSSSGNKGSSSSKTASKAAIYSKVILTNNDKHIKKYVSIEGNNKIVGTIEVPPNEQRLFEIGGRNYLIKIKTYLNANYTGTPSKEKNIFVTDFLTASTIV